MTCATGGLFLLALIYAAIGMQIEPFWVLLAAAVPPIVLLLMRKLPVVFMATLLYMGNFKTHGAVGFSLSDPTVIAVALLYAVVALEILVLVSGIEKRSLRDQFEGQIHGVAAFLLFVLVIAASFAYTPAPAVGAEKVLKLVVIDVMAFLAPLILIRGEREVLHLVVLSLGLSLVLAVRALYYLANPAAGLLGGLEDPTRIGDGLLMGIAALMVLYCPLTKKTVLRLALLMCVVFLTVGISASVSRTDILSVLVVMVFAAIFLPQSTALMSRRGNLLTLAGIVLTIVLAIACLQHLPGTHSKVTQKLAELSAAWGGSTPGGTAGQRVAFSASAFHAFTEKPLLGWGAGGWSTLYHLSDERVLLYPHNFVLETAAEQGVVGLVALGLVLLAMARAFATIFRAKDSRLMFIIPVMMLCLLCSTTTGQVEDRVTWFWCGAVFALARLATHYQLAQAERDFSRYSFGDSAKCHI
jgi:O-antigen ligase